LRGRPMCIVQPLKPQFFSDRLKPPICCSSTCTFTTWSLRTQGLSPTFIGFRSGFPFTLYGSRGGHDIVADDPARAHFWLLPWVQVIDATETSTTGSLHNGWRNFPGVLCGRGSR
jgi:hypothetical protein